MLVLFMLVLFLLILDLFSCHKKYIYLYDCQKYFYIHVIIVVENIFIFMSSLLSKIFLYSYHHGCQKYILYSCHHCYQKYILYSCHLDYCQKYFYIHVI